MSGQATEDVAVKLAGIHFHVIATVVGLQPVVAGQRAAQVAHPHPQGRFRLRGRLVSPERVNQERPGRRLPGMQEQHCQGAALRWAPEGQPGAIIVLDR